MQPAKRWYRSVFTLKYVFIVERDIEAELRLGSFYSPNGRLSGCLRRHDINGTYHRNALIDIDSFINKLYFLNKNVAVAVRWCRHDSVPKAR